MTITSRGAVAPTTHPNERRRSGYRRPRYCGDNESAPRLDTDALDIAVNLVADHAPGWTKTDAAARAKLLQEVIDATMAAQDDWLAAACAAKGLEPGSTEAGEELFAGIGTFVRMARLFRDSLRDIAKDGKPSFAGPVREATDGRLRVQVFPASGLRPHHLPPDDRRGLDAARRHPASPSSPARPPPTPTGAAPADTALVLAAGNVASLGPRDVLYKLFVEDKVVIMKANPVNDYLVPHWSRALKPLLDAGVLRIVDGGAAVGEYLTAHPRIDEVHITGSDKTYDAVVFGTGPEGARRKAADEPVLDKPVTAELGNVSPIIVVPGKWSIPELRYQAEHVATMLVNNAGFNCISARVVVTHDAWPQRDAFIGALTQTLADIRTRRAYYPGAAERRDAFVAAHPEADSLGAGRPTRCPGPSSATCPPGAPTTSASTSSPSSGNWPRPLCRPRTRRAFLDAATEFCNDVVWGTLGATILVAPSSLKEPVVGRRVGARGRGPALRVHRRQRLARVVVRHGVDDVGRLPGTPAHRHPVGDRRRGQRRHVRPTAEVGRAGAFPLPAQAALVRDGAVVLRRHASLCGLRGRAVSRQDSRIDARRNAALRSVAWRPGAVARPCYIVLARSCGIAYGAAATTAAMSPRKAPNSQPTTEPPGLSMKAMNTRTRLTIVATIIIVRWGTF